MRVSELLAAGHTFSVELLPPRSPAAQERLEQVLVDLEPLGLSFISITYGAGGSTRERTHELVVRLQREGKVAPVAHLTCAAHRREDLVDILTRYRDAGVENILALHGDPPLDNPDQLNEGDLAHASDLVGLAREVSAEFCVAVAAHPEGHPRSPDLDTDRDYLAMKLERAEVGITQFFFEVDDYLAMVDTLAARGVTKPVIPGIMPITSFRTVSRMAEMSGTAVPARIRERIEAVSEQPDEIRRIGVEVATELGEKLLAQGVPGLHIYTMNQSAATLEIHANLGIAARAGWGTSQQPH